MTEPSNGHAIITRTAMEGRTLGRELHARPKTPNARSLGRGPRISNPDYTGALICMKTQRQVKAVQLLHGGGYIDPGTLSNYSKISEIQALMRAGPLYHLGPERRGLSWARPNDPDNDDYLISLSLYRRNQTAESWVYSTTEEMANHARKLGIDHAYVWSLDPDDKNAPGDWDYVRTNTHRHVLIPYEERAKTALETLRDILELEPPDEDGRCPTTRWNTPCRNPFPAPSFSWTSDASTTTPSA